MVIYAVVPVKSLGTSKKRLSSVLTPQERGQLTLTMLEDVLRALQTSVVDHVVVVSNDLMAHNIASKFGSAYIAQKNGGLNSAIEEASDWCVKQGAEAVLFLPADIPLLASEDVDRIIKLGSYESQAVVFSSSYNDGTNAIFQNPPNLIPWCFGAKSFIKHIKEAQNKGARLRFYYSANVANDIDSAQDLGKLLKTEGNTASQSLLDKFEMRRRLSE